MAKTAVGTRPDPASARPPPIRSDRRLDYLAIAIIAAAFLLPLRGLLNAPGPPMEEGFMLVFPERVLAGDIPNKDFLHLYGPGSLWVLAAVYKVFGTTLVTERLFGLFQEMAVVYGIYFLTRRWGRVAALSCALTAVVIIIEPHGLVAMPWVGAIGLGIWGLVAGLASREAATPERSRRMALVCGLLFGLALLYRLDLAIAVLLATLALAPGTATIVKKRFALGIGLGLFPYLIHAAMAGFGNAVQGMIIDPIFNLRGGRSLPIPPDWSIFDSTVQFVSDFVKLSWPVPRLHGPAQVFLWFFGLLGALLLLGVVAIRAIRRQPTSTRARVLLVAAGFSIGLVPQALQRPDPTHLAWVGCVGMSLVPIAVIELVQGWRSAWPRRTVALAVGGVYLLGLFLVIPNYTARSYVDFTAQGFGEHTRSYKMKHDGRVFINGQKSNADGANELLPVADRITDPGDRLFVGTKDLRQTPMSEVSFYYLLPELVPATYYIEMDPGVANAPGSGLADDVRSADILVLSSAWDYWDEPNDSRKFGPSEPNKVVRNKFCLVGKFGPEYYLYERCEK